SGGRCTGMRYDLDGYVQKIVIGCKLKLVGWPEGVPFGNLSNIGGGMWALRELQRLWYLPEESAFRLRFEDASEEDVAAAKLDPMSAHPHPTKRGITPKRKAVRRAEDPPPAVVKALVFHPLTLDFLGTHATSTEPGAGDAPVDGSTRDPQQRKDNKRRRVWASKPNPHRKRLPKRGVLSMRSVIPGLSEAGSSSSGGRAAKRAREDYAVDDRLEDIEWSSEYGGRLSLY
ncbi:hypothetical protein C2E23DRAFT_699301, partial [Lenzites betulinus]